MLLKFSRNFVKIKSSWFDQNSILSQIGVDNFLIYLQLYRFYVSNQERDTFLVSLKHLRKITGLTKLKIIESLRTLEKNKIITTDVYRWTALDQTSMIVIEAIDSPSTEREGNEESNLIDKPVSTDDFYISIDMKMIQEYLDRGMGACCICIYVLLNKFNSNLDAKIDISIREMSERLSVSRFKIQNCIYEMNRAYLMYSAYMPNNKMRNSNNSKTPLKFEHYIFKKHKELLQLQQEFKKRIDSNVSKWGRSEY